MTKSVPAGCKTPAKDREDYCFTMSDIKFMTAQVEKIDAMLSYYINMPENRTGELAVFFRSEKGYEAYLNLTKKIVDVLSVLDDVDWRKY